MCKLQINNFVWLFNTDIKNTQNIWHIHETTSSKGTLLLSYEQKDKWISYDKSKVFVLICYPICNSNCKVVQMTGKLMINVIIKYCQTEYPRFKPYLLKTHGQSPIFWYFTVKVKLVDNSRFSSNLLIVLSEILLTMKPWFAMYLLNLIKA